jgi:hypothetical protein
LTFDEIHESKRATHWALTFRVQAVVLPSASHVAKMSTEPSE